MNVDYFFYWKLNKFGFYLFDDLGDIVLLIGLGDLVWVGIVCVFEQIDWQELFDVLGVWFGIGGVVFQFIVEFDGCVMSFMGLCFECCLMLQFMCEMGFIVFDLQCDIVYG